MVACYLGGIVSGVFLHELGHALMALLVTRQKVELEVGADGGRKVLRLGRLELVGRSQGLRYGATRYNRGTESRGTQAWVSAGGPVASLAAVLVFGWLLVDSVVGDWLWIVWLGLLAANFRIFIVSVWPMEYRPRGPGGEVWLSDGLDLWRLLTSKRD